MKLVTISKYGFITNETKQWNNYAKTFLQEKKFKKEDIGKEISFRSDKNGAVIETFILKEKLETITPNVEPTKTKSKKVKIITADDPQIFEGELNKFGMQEKVTQTQTHYESGLFIGVCFYD